MAFHSMHRATWMVVLGFGFSVAPFATSAVAADVFVYGLHLKGKLSVNGTVLDSLRTNFDDDPQSGLQERYGDLLIAGAERYALRRDGTVYQTGKRLFTLPYDAIRRAEWVNLVLLGSSLFSLREDGVLSTNATVAATLPVVKGDFIFPFSRLLAGGSDLYSLRSDGAIFKNSSVTPLFELVGGNGVSGAADGRSLETVWIRAAVSPGDGDLYALRADGVILRGNLPPLNAMEAKGSLVTRLPFPTSLPIVPGDLYVDFGFTADGKWFALRANGAIYSELSVIAPVVDLPGDATSSESAYQDLAFLGNDYWSLRGDGRVYKNTSLEEAFDLPQSLYGRIAIGTEPPSLTSFKNSVPVVSTYKVTALVGTTIAVPVLLTDTDKITEDVTVTPVAVPPGSSFNAETRILTWENVGPVGKYLLLVNVSDGVKSKAYRYPIKVIALDTDPLKNKPPVVAKIKKVQALVDVELAMPILASDPDGDTLTITAVTGVYPFTAGATFDAETNTFSWTPTLSDVGKTRVRFLVSDGIKTKALTVPISVLSPLGF